MYFTVDQSSIEVLKNKATITPMEYISDILKKYTCILNFKSLSKKKELTISVNSAAYNQVYEYFLSKDNSREAKHNSREIAKLYFLLMLFISTAYHKIKNEDTGEETNVLKREINLLNKDISYDGLSDTKFKSLKKVLSSEDNRFIECILSRETTDIYNNKVWLSKPTLYRLTNLPLNNSSSIVNLKYTKVNKKLINILPNPNLPIYTGQNSLQFIELQQDAGNLRVDKPKKQWSLDLFISFYNRLWVTDIVGNYCKDRTADLHKTEKGLRPDNRIYTGFHILDKDIRPRVYMDNEPLVESFDVHNCHATLINAILPKTIPTKEKELYLSKTISGTFYEDVMEYVNHKFKTECNIKNTIIADEYLSQKFDKPWSRDDTKTAVNKYLNLSKKKLKRAIRTYELRRPWKSVNKDAVYVDEYFKTFFPSIREFIITTPKTNKVYEKIPGKKRSQKTIYEIVDDIVKQKPIKKCKKLSDMVTLNDMLNTVETDIITNYICKDLYENYNITAISLHDGIFVKKSDCSRMPNVVKEFNDLITYYDVLK